MTQEEFEESMERILRPIKENAEKKLDFFIVSNIFQNLRNSGYPFRYYETTPGGKEVKAIVDEIYALLGNWPYEIDEIRFLAYAFAKAGVDRERGWRYLKKTCLRKKFWYPDLVATRKTYDRMYNRVTPDVNYRERFKEL
jgi:hypothetical protein